MTIEEMLRVSIHVQRTIRVKTLTLIAHPFRAIAIRGGRGSIHETVTTSHSPLRDLACVGEIVAHEIVSIGLRRGGARAHVKDGSHGT